MAGGLNRGGPVSAAQFTRGPWQLREVNDLDIAYSVDAGRNTVADVYYHADEWRANANLIAAAPELFEACQALLAEIEKTDRRSCKAVGVARAALAQARGETA